MSSSGGDVSSVVSNRTRQNASHLCARLKAKACDEDSGEDVETRGETRVESRDEVEVELVVAWSKRGERNLLTQPICELYIHAGCLG